MVVVVALLLGVDPMTLLNSGLVGTDRIEGENLTEADQRAGEFVSVTLADTEEIWSAIFDAEVGQAYRPATLVLYKGITQSSCAMPRARRGRPTARVTARSISTPFLHHAVARTGRQGRFRRGLCRGA